MGYEEGAKTPEDLIIYAISMRKPSKHIADQIKNIQRQQEERLTILENTAKDQWDAIAALANEIRNVKNDLAERDRIIGRCCRHVRRTECRVSELRDEHSRCYQTVVNLGERAAQISQRLIRE
ncbi:hypothetical protein QAD02_013635 [Eretmocerus hayati]|uniref:Uncharacterized protein n=1 Tax=Eretmocerus hayati TaxID=131215 RepID=A0ACC2P412_9HYME|nr:hypothetical protein QAD02_013635 [Eretmocerus hayati]